MYFFVCICFCSFDKRKKTLLIKTNLDIEIISFWSLPFSKYQKFKKNWNWNDVADDDINFALGMFYKCSRGAYWLPDFQVVFVFFKWALRSAVQCFLLVSCTLTSPCLRIQSVFFSSKLLLDAPCSSLYNGVQDIFHPQGKLQFLRLLWCRTSKWRKWNGSIQKFLNAIIPMPCHSFGLHFKTTKPFLPVTFILFNFWSWLDICENNTTFDVSGWECQAKYLHSKSLLSNFELVGAIF